ncbi:MAG TPA: alpha/beta hydrolase-fold protein [Flavobacterium sp.]|uniref:alpha/beta hydrolase n=1 Tax=Flavobacterium sp. TaxID=239 RepID=UPI002CC86BDC|nr:alpha/beta hydrolase-fold protein [Flavobacterium sp.]HNP33855.1 alpha/beta hydrolase-fold protein [Flavobacterium sp.]
MKTKIITLLFTIIGMVSTAQITVYHGSVQRLEGFQSKYVQSRNVDIWFPDGYSDKEKYPVLYMNDGQGVFDPSATWNQQAWKVDQAAGKLISENKIQKVIVVAIWNNGSKRHSEYFPQKPFESLSKKTQDSLYSIFRDNKQPLFSAKVCSDNYLKFVVTELKPFIDKTFSTKADAANTFIAGSSMGGLISLYAICEYPEVFGGAACLSTHWPGAFFVKNNPIPDAFFAYMKAHLPDPKNHKIYFDYGDQTLDALYPPFQKKADVIMKDKGFTAENWITQFFPGKDHSENSWAERVHIPLEFLLKKQP